MPIYERKLDETELIIETERYLTALTDWDIKRIVYIDYRDVLEVITADNKYEIRAYSLQADIYEKGITKAYKELVERIENDITNMPKDKMIEKLLEEGKSLKEINDKLNEKQLFSTLY